MEEQERERTLIKNAEELSQNLGFAKENTNIVEIRKTDDPKIREMVLLQGTWGDKRPMIAVDHDNPKNVYVFLTAEHFKELMEALKQSTQENFNLKLEKAIWKHIPADFEDVWVVAADKINRAIQNSQDPTSLNINLDQLVDEIKREHPSLFVNLADIDPRHKIIINPAN
jgi:hypothetical protein